MKRFAWLLLTLAASLAAAQEEPPGGTIAGVVHDTSGDAVSGAIVTLTHRATGERRLALTGGDGSFSVRDAHPGSYEVEVKRKGFDTAKRDDVVLEDGAKLHLDFGLVPETGEQPAAGSPAAGALKPLTRNTPTESPSKAGPMRPLLPGERPTGRPAAGYDPAKAAVVLAVTLRKELGLPDRGLPRVDLERGSPPGWDERLEKARSVLAAGRADEAEALFRGLIDEYPVPSGPYQGIAECRLARGERKVGLLLLERIGGELTRVGRQHEALRVLERSTELNPDDADVLALLGRTLNELLRYGEAVEVLKRAVELGREDLLTLLHLASAYWETGDFKSSEALFARAVELHGESAEALRRLGQFLLWQGRPAEAAGYLEKALARSPDDAEILLALGRAQAQSGRLEPAVASYERLLERYPDHVGAQHALAVLGKRREENRMRPAPLPPSSMGDRIALTSVLPPGIDFRHDPGVSEAKHMPEIMGSGLAWIDYDGDGWWDVYFVQSGAFPPDGGERSANRLYRNLGDGTFEDVTSHTGAGARNYGQGAVAADADGDGWTDLYLTSYGDDVFLRNRGDGTFEDATASSGLATPNWSTSAAFADADGDGDLDLYVARYLDYRVDHGHFCGDPETGVVDYCDVDLFDGVGDRFYVNDGDGTFTDWTEDAGLGGATARGLGVIWLDLDGDAAPDVYVANDLMPNYLWKSGGDGTFEDDSLFSGTALNWEGHFEAGMGVTAGDVDADGDADIAVTNFDLETNTLYVNLGDLQFDDAATSSGFGTPSFNLLGFGVVLADFDRDADLDAYVANGHVIEHPHRKVVDFLQDDLLLAGDGRGGFVEHGHIGPPDLGRGAVAADYDNDGDPDVMVQNNREAPTLLRNDAKDGQWLGVELHGRGRNTAAVGAKVTLQLGQRRLTRWVMAGDSYLSSGDKRLLFGWPEDVEAGALEVVWPSGGKSRFEGLPSGRFLHLNEPTK